MEAVRNSNGQAYRPSVCVVCGDERLRRSDMLRTWSGKCKRCSTREVAARPEIRAMMRENGLRTPPDRSKVKNLRRGPDNNKWRGGITAESQKVRTSPETRRWRLAVFARDNHTCQMCERRGGDLQADHIKPFSLYPRLRHSLENGRTLCVPCHRRFGACVSNGKITREAVLTRPDGTNWRIG